MQVTRPAGSPDTTAQPNAIRVGAAVPPIAGTTLDGQPFDLASLRGRPVLINFWGPSCVPCRDEFPLLEQELKAHAADGLAVVGVLYGDGPDEARKFVADYGGTWPTVVDPSKEIASAYKVAARPQSYFVDRDGILRSIPVGEITPADFDRQFQTIAG